ncbi:SLBB domain-containing protein [Terriglobus saanensis]|uniref:Polysaccharide export protein n=1 Tax=Terriglobus saanensis (strain ATCC BAA-1853 / DSM 23119 / SP1PR4) TaxID=401053 RepID=E8V351_TERSS|nr:SLBB domain-containing protein [Terriglobus saanensis]ADV81326.1 polysaccharide export protein [Terriglobus saanensis SP1PR4]
MLAPSRTTQAKVPLCDFVRRLALLTPFFLLGVSPLISAQSTSSCDPTSSDCRDSSNSGSGQNGSTAYPTQGAGDVNGSNSTREQKADQGTQLYVDSASTNNRRQTDTNRTNVFFPPDPLVDMQRLAKAATGETLPVFGRDLFQRAPSTFAPADQIPALADYLLGPGDEVLLRLWGPESFNGQLTVDSTGSIYVPQVGAIHVAGLRVDQLQEHISADIRHTFRNFNLSVNLGHLRSIQIYVVGEARRPGAYTVSALSTVLNVLFVSGGPNVQGSLRRIQVRREGKVVSELDLYDLILRGDKSQDIRLQANDTIFIPAAGPQAALAGSVRHPAVYELRGDTTVGGLLELAGGFTPTGSTTQISLERIEENRSRAAMTVNLDEAGKATVLHDGDVLFANHISAAYQQSVTIRGNLANPGRFPWHAGMHLSDIIPDRMSLLTRNYWEQRNRLGVPVPLFEPLRPMRPRQQTSRTQNGQTQNGQTQNGQTNNTTNDSTTGIISNRAGISSLGPDPDTLDSSQDSSVDQNYNGSSSNGNNQVSNSNQRNQNSQDSQEQGDREGLMRPPETSLSSGSLAEEQQAATSHNIANIGQRNTIKIPAPEIDWSYAVIERLDPITLKNSLVPFNPEKLLQNHDPSQNLELQPGDIVTILSQADVHVPQDEQTKFVRLEGEFKGSGVYSVSPDETLADLVQRAGGLSTKAYLYGASFTRESARIAQQQRLDEYVTSVSISMQRSAAIRAASSNNAVVDPNALVEQRDIIAQLRKLRATGRIVLEFRPESTGGASIPRIPLEDGDVFRVPSRPLTVNVIGAVYGQNVFLFDSRRRVEDYVLLAGKENPIADRSHAFIIRADGSVYSRQRAKGVWKNSFDAAQINPGDSIVIPEKPIKPAFIRQFVDYSQLFSSFALGAAALSVIKQ